MARSQWIGIGADPGSLPALGGNFHLYDPTSKILYTGDVGASLGCEYREVPDFEDHVPFMSGFHKRYMASSLALKTWSSLSERWTLKSLRRNMGPCFAVAKW